MFGKMIVVWVIYLDYLDYNSNMSTFKSPEVHICGRIKTIVDFAKS